MTKEELKHNFINGVMDLRNKGLVEQDSLLDLFEDVIEPCITDFEKENAELKEKYNELSKAVFELKGEFMACPLDDTDRLGELIDRLNNL